MSHFHTIGMIAKQGDPARVRGTLTRLAEHLRACRVEVLLDPESAHLLEAPVGAAVPRSRLAERCDLVVVVGGDGTLLHTARLMARRRVPVLGVNLGRLGFLVDVSPEEIDTALDQVLAGQYVKDHRAMLRARLLADETPDVDYTALNDVVIHKWGTARLIELEIFIDGAFVNAQRSDGLILATPTGSTAYALSGGGPLLDPSLDVILLVPICPHDLTNRPLVVPGGSRIEIRVRGSEQGHVQVTCDGQIASQLPPRGRVEVSRDPDRVCLIHPTTYHHYDILRAKLGWGGRASGDASSDVAGKRPDLDPSPC